MKIVFISSECVPYASTGGLGDVSSSLPIALHALGHDVCRILPLYRSVTECNISLSLVQSAIPIGIGYETRMAEVYASDDDGVPTYFISREEYFDRSHLYGLPHRDYDDLFERFLFFQKAAVALIDLLRLDADMVHTHDWQTGLVGFFLEHGVQGRGRGRQERTVFTIHNLGYQGLFPGTEFARTGLPYPCFSTEDGLEFYGKLSCLKGGLVSADAVTTVSESYAEEIRTEDGGRGLEGVLSGLGDRLVGITNGIDYTAWNPATDKSLTTPYDSDSSDEGKKKAKNALREKVGLSDAPDIPLIGMITRLTHHKGLDLLSEAMPEIMKRNLQFVLLGSGEPGYCDLAADWMDQWNGKCVCEIGFDAGLARLIYAAADIILVPSVFEPCGLSQLYCMRYGGIPVVHRTGGLADTVVDVREDPVDGTGFQFSPHEKDPLVSAIDAALDIWNDPASRKAIRQRGMARDSSWNTSAAKYVQLYESVLGSK